MRLTSWGWNGFGVLEQEQWLPIPLSEAWSFFSEPKNLNAITPEHLQFRLLTPTPSMYSGQLLAYKIRLAPMIWTTWVTQIVESEFESHFIDEQRHGPYRMWYHEHRFIEQDGGTLMTDRVTYQVPGWIFARFVRRLYIDRQLRQIFSYRKQVLADRFSE